MNAGVSEEALILGIESSCDETAAAVVRGGRNVLSNVIASQHHLHEKFGGVVPEIASRAHIERIVPVIDEALETAGVTLESIDVIAVGNRPGLIGSLLVGVAAAKTLAWSLGKPLIAVDHVQAHLHAGALDGEPIEFPALGLVVSGGHSSLYHVSSPTEMRLIGRTIDDAVGEAYDKVAAILQLGFPGGPIVDQLAQHGNDRAVNFPRTLLEADSLDFSFSGLKTAVLYHVRGQPQGRGKTAGFARDASSLGASEKADIAASFQRAAVDVIIKKMMRAIEQIESEGEKPRTLIVGGGVSANSALRQSVTEWGERIGASVRLPRMAYCMDNAAMIAGLGFERIKIGEIASLDLEACATASVSRN